MSAARTLLGAALLALPATHAVAALKPSPACKPNLAGVAKWNGVWIAQGLESPISGRVKDGTAAAFDATNVAGFDAPWNEAGLARFEAMLKLAVSDKLKQAGWGFPMMMKAVAPFTIVIAPQETLIVNQYREVRYIYTDGRRHLPEDERWPTPWGDSVGCWKDGTLTIETVSAGYIPQFTYWGPPISDDAVFVEKLHMVNPNRIESQITVTDPATLERPWVYGVVYERHDVIKRMIHDGDMFDNDRTRLDGPTGGIAPPAPEITLDLTPPAKPDAKLTMAQLDRLVGDYAVEGAPIKMHVVRRGALLWMNPDGGVAIPIHPQDEYDFADRMMGLPVHFQTDAAGSVVGLEGPGPDMKPMKATRIKAK